jgi:hypothetical protein
MLILKFYYVIHHTEISVSGHLHEKSEVKQKLTHSLTPVTQL